MSWDLVGKIPPNHGLSRDLVEIIQSSRGWENHYIGLYSCLENTDVLLLPWTLVVSFQLGIDLLKQILNLNNKKTHPTRGIIILCLNQV